MWLVSGKCRCACSYCRAPAPAARPCDCDKPEWSTPQYADPAARPEPAPSDEAKTDAHRWLDARDRTVAPEDSLAALLDATHNAAVRECADLATLPGHRARILALLRRPAKAAPGGSK